LCLLCGWHGISTHEIGSEVKFTCKQTGEIIFVICVKSRVHPLNLFPSLDETVALSAPRSFYDRSCKAGAGGLPPCEYDRDGLLFAGLQNTAEKARPFLFRDAFQCLRHPTEVAMGLAFGKRAFIQDKQR
jgi:hypothetical protein